MGDKITSLGDKLEKQQQDLKAGQRASGVCAHVRACVCVWCVCSVHICVCACVRLQVCVSVSLRMCGVVCHGSVCGV